MGDSRLNRVDETLKSLFESLIPPLEGEIEDDSSLNLRLDSAIRAAKETVHGGEGRLPADINQAQDLIKKKLLRENASPEKAARFSNLYSRLLSIPVLNQKWSILYLLYKLSEDAPSEYPPRTPLTESDHAGNVRRQPNETYEKRVIATTPPQQREGKERLSPARPQERFESLIAGAPNRKNQVKGSDVQGDSKQVNTATDQKDAGTPTARPSGPSELELLRDLPFNLQGLSSTHLEFVSSASIRLPSTLPVPILSLLFTLAEPCLLYKQLDEFVTNKSGGLVCQSLRAAVSDELRSYLSLVASLEGEIRRVLKAIEQGDDSKSIRMAGVTLKRSVIWTKDATMGLRLLSLVVEESKQKRGGQIISLIHGLSSSHGDPFVGSFAERLLEHVARPFYEMLRRWIYDGELIDPFNEFFVTEPDLSSKPEIDPRRVATSVWEDKYKLDSEMVPTIVPSDFAKKVFLIGKSLNFIRHNCGDSDWVIQYSKTHSKSLDHVNTANLSSTIDKAYQTTMSRLINLMSSKFGLFTHLLAIKRYLLMSQGDFMDLLVDSLAESLSRPANSQYRHTLTSQLEHAIRHSNAQYDDPEILGRLDARMLELSSGDTGWECFTLEYKVSAPCDVVITQWASTQYLKVFNLLWRIKRVQYSLSKIWQRCMTGSRGVLATVDDKLGRDWKRARCVVAEMVYFINQLQYYILFEVIETSWETLQQAIDKPELTLDDLIEAHTVYLSNITNKGLLGSARGSSTSRQEIDFLEQLHYIMKAMISYLGVVESLYSYSVAEFTKRQQFSARVEHRTAQGKWGITEKDLIADSRSSTPGPAAWGTKPGKFNATADEADSPMLPLALDLKAGDEQTLLTSLRSRLIETSADYHSRFNMLLYDLSHQSDAEVKFLSTVMNFNDFYKPVNVRRQQKEKKKQERKERERMGHGRENSVAAASTPPESRPS